MLRITNDSNKTVTVYLVKYLNVIENVNKIWLLIEANNIITMINIIEFDCNKNHKKAMYLPTLVVYISNHPVRTYNIPFTIVHSSIVLIIIANCFFEA